MGTSFSSAVTCFMLHLALLSWVSDNIALAVYSQGLVICTSLLEITINLLVIRGIFLIDPHVFSVIYFMSL